MTVAPTPVLTLAEAARMLRDMKGDEYQAYPLGREVDEYLRWKRGRLTQTSYATNRSFLTDLACHFLDLELADLEPPAGTQRLEEWLDRRWGDKAARTYNKNLSMAKEFFKWAVLRGKLHGDPTLPLLPHKKRDVHREIFRADDRARIFADGPHPDHLRRDRILLRLILDYGLRKGALRAVQFRHFDANRRRLTIFTKGGRVRELPLPDPALWDDLGKLQFELEASPQHFLLPRHKTMMKFAGYDRKTGEATTRRLERYFPDEPVGNHGAHDWWYGCLQRAGIVAEGVFRGERMHKGRHTAGQRVLDETGNLKAAQRLLGHASIATTGDIYTDWDADQLAETMARVLNLGGDE